MNGHDTVDPIRSDDNVSLKLFARWGRQADSIFGHSDAGDRHIFSDFDAAFFAVIQESLVEFEAADQCIHRPIRFEIYDVSRGRFQHDFVDKVGWNRSQHRLQIRKAAVDSATDSATARFQPGKSAPIEDRYTTATADEITSGR